MTGAVDVRGGERLKGKHAVLTGAGGGIGLAVAQAFFAQGARCTVADTGPQGPEALAGAAFADRVHYVQTDVTKIAQVDALLDAAEQRFGDIHVLFNNAAIFDMAPFLESTEASYDKVFAVNVKGMFFVMQKCLARMVAKRVNQASVID